MGHTPYGYRIENGNGNLQAYMLMMVFPVPTLKTETSLIA